MLTISIDPIAFTIGSHQVRWYGIMAAIAVTVLLVILFREAKRLGITRYLYGIALWGIIGGLIGGRLAYVIYYWEHFMANPREIIGFAGLAQMGMIIGKYPIHTKIHHFFKFFLLLNSKTKCF